MYAQSLVSLEQLAVKLDIEGDAPVDKFDKELVATGKEEEFAIDDFLSTITSFKTSGPRRLDCFQRICETDESEQDNCTSNLLKSNFRCEHENSTGVRENKNNS